MTRQMEREYREALRLRQLVRKVLRPRDISAALDVVDKVERALYGAPVELPDIMDGESGQPVTVPARVYLPVMDKAVKALACGGSWDVVLPQVGRGLFGDEYHSALDLDIKNQIYREWVKRGWHES